MWPIFLFLPRSDVIHISITDQTTAKSNLVVKYEYIYVYMYIYIYIYIYHIYTNTNLIGQTHFYLTFLLYCLANLINFVI